MLVGQLLWGDCDITDSSIVLNQISRKIFEINKTLYREMNYKLRRLNNTHRIIKVIS